MSHQSRICVIYPKTIPDAEFDTQHVFLAGPIRNAPPWHEDAIDIISTLVRECNGIPRLQIYSPKRSADMIRKLPVEDISFKRFMSYSRQRAWEFDAQEIAVHSAGLLFWLPKEGSREHPDKVYGAITQVEFGYWLARASVDPSLKIAFGTDGVYNGELHTLLYDIGRLAPHLLPIHTSLESLCARSILWAHEKGLYSF